MHSTVPHGMVGTKDHHREHGAALLYVARYIRGPKLQGGRYAAPCSRRAQHARLGSKCEIKRDAKTAQGCVLCTVGSSRASLLCRHRSPVAQNTNFFK